MTRVPQDLSTHTKESISLQKASEWEQSHVIVFYGKCGSLGDVGVIVKHAVCDYVVMLVYSRFG
jgi:predicted ATP-binding protein involved in virulence